jgi:hypothetical protein
VALLIEASADLGIQTTWRLNLDAWVAFGNNNGAAAVGVLGCVRALVSWDREFIVFLYVQLRCPPLLHFP